MPRKDPQAILVDGEGNVFGSVWGLGPDDDMSIDKLRTENGPVANVVAHGAEGDGVADDTAAFNSAISAADANDGAVAIPSGEYLVNTVFNVPAGVSIHGAGPTRTTIKSTNTTEIETFIANSHNSFSGFTSDQNAAGRSQQWTTGIHIQDCDHVTVENIGFKNVSTTVNGSGVFLEAEETDTQDTHHNRILNCRFVGDNQDGNNGGDFLIRARTAFGSDLETSAFTRFLRDNTIEHCFFTGQGKAAIELVGPATRENYVKNCLAKGFTTCVGVFESSLGAKSNTFESCRVVDSFGDGGIAAFYADGYQGSLPHRRSEDNLFIDCRAINLEEIGTSYAYGFRTRLDDRTRFVGCLADDITSATAGNAAGCYIQQSNEVEVDSPTVKNAPNGIKFNSADSPNISDAHFVAVPTLIQNPTSSTRPRWNGALGDGPLGGIDLATVSGDAPRDEAVDANGYGAVWTGTQWRRSDGTLV